MNIFNIRRAFEQKREKGWKKLYWCVDLHDVVIEGKYNKFNEGAAIFPHAKEFFQWANKRKDMILILWTSSYEEALDKTLLRLGEEGILFHFVNANPLEKNNSLCDFNKKFYFNILLDDKAGFDGATDWGLIINELKEIGEWDKA
jgi:hypothetical protein